MDAPTPLQILEAALAEDHWHQDLTSDQVEVFLGLKGVDPVFNKSFFVVAKEDGIFSGAIWISALAEASGCEIESMVEDGTHIAAGHTVCRGRGAWKDILAIERTLLNGLQAFCGIATVTRRYVDTVNSAWAAKGFAKGQEPGVYHTRKISPLVRDFAVKAVIDGGGRAHRKNLSDRVLVKENHKAIVIEKGHSYEEFARFVNPLQKGSLFEVETKEEAVALAKAGVKHLLLDNFAPALIAQTLKEIPPGVEIEISGGLTLDNVKDYLLPGVQRLSFGALTHSVKALDLSLDWVSEK